MVGALDPTARVPLGHSNLQVTQLGLGLAPIGDLHTPTSEGQALATIDRAWERGVRLIDTAPLYGYGRSEQLAGRALRQRPRGDYVLSTKVGRILQPQSDAGEVFWGDPPPSITLRWDFSYDGVLRSIRASQQRLGLDRIDVLHLHDPEDHLQEALEGGYRALDELRATGEIGAVSVGTTRVDRIPDMALRCRFDCFMIAGRYTLLDQSALDVVLPMCEQRGIGVLAAGVFNSGVLASPDANARFDYQPADQAVIERARAIQAVCRQSDVPLRAAAIQFPFCHPAVTAVVVGARTPEEVDDALAGFSHQIPSELWTHLKTAGLLPEGVPHP